MRYITGYRLRMQYTYAGYRLRIHLGGGASLPQIACWHKL